MSNGFGKGKYYSKSRYKSSIAIISITITCSTGWSLGTEIFSYESWMILTPKETQNRKKTCCINVIIMELLGKCSILALN